MSDVEVVEGTVEDEAPAVRHLPATVEPEQRAMVTAGEITVSELLEQSRKVAEAMGAAMQEGTHYGLVPGVSKPTLLKPGAEKLCVLFRLAPHYERELVYGPGDHLTAIVACTLRHAPTGMVIATGEGLCTTRESKYAYRRAEMECPDCGQPAIVRSAKKSAYFCIRDKGGCGHRFAFGSEQGRELDGQEVGRKENPDLCDSWNTVLKMADKRALVAAVLNGTAASDVFTQDVEETARQQASGEPEPAADPVDRPFDPSKDLLPGAKQFTVRAPMKKIAAALEASAPHVDWSATLNGLASSVYGVTEVKKIPRGEAFSTFTARLANATAKLDELAPGGTMPATDEQIMEAFAWAFEGIAAEVVANPGEPQDPGGTDPDPDEAGAAEADAAAGESDAQAAAQAEAEHVEMDMAAFNAEADAIPFGDEGGSS